MTPDDTLERHLATGMASLAQSGAPDYLDDVLGRSSRTRQRRAWLPLQRSVFPARAPHERAGRKTGRSLSMIPILRIAAVAVLAMAVGVGGVLLRPITDIGSPDPSTSASPIPTPARLPAEGGLPAGTYAVRPFAAPGSDACGEPSDPICDEAVPDDTIDITFTVPDGWAGNGGDGMELATGFGQNLDGAAMIFVRGASLYNDPCDDGSGRIPVGPTAADFADALADHPLLDVTTPVDVSVGGYPGKYLELQVPDDPTIQGSSEPGSLEGCPVYRPWEPWYLARMGGERWLLWIVDVAGHRVVAQAMVHPATTDEVEEQLRQIVDSIEFTPATAPVASPSPAALTYSSASLEQDWPGPIRAEPSGDPLVVSWDGDHSDVPGDIGSADVPWIDIVSVKHLPCAQNGVCVEFGASVPTGLDESWIAYGLVFDEDLDGVADVRLGMHIVPAGVARTGGGEGVGTWRTNLRTGITESGNAHSSICDCFGTFGTTRHFYPGELSSGQRYLGRFYTWASVIQDGRVVATDYAPDAGWLAGSPES